MCKLTDPSYNHQLIIETNVKVVNLMYLHLVPWQLISINSKTLLYIQVMNKVKCDTVIFVMTLPLKIRIQRKLFMVFKIYLQWQHHFN